MYKRLATWLNQPRAGRLALMLVPLVCGLASMLTGQDDNWDLRNYHVYNVYALLHDRIGYDLAPGRFQTYFNPTLDLLYYWLNHWLPLPAAGFAMGALHGLNFVLLLAIARALLGAAAGNGVPLLLAGACMLGPAFRGELGNTMGDNSTALLVLGALALLLRRWEALQQGGARAAWTVLGAGLLLGLGTGLKLTNAPYAVALCVAVLAAAPAGFWRRLRLAFGFGVGVLAGIGVTGGWWFLKMWHTFGNPLFPQFNNLFHSPWASEAGVIDTTFLPKALSEYLLWPFIFAQHAARVTEIPIKLAMWPAVYVLFAGLALAVLWRRARGDRRATVSPPARLVLLFFGLGYLAWMRMFSIYRYLIPLELLLPLVIWLLWHGLAAPAAARRLAAATLAVLLLAALPIPNWGHAPWAAQAYSAQVPPFADAAQSVVYIAEPEPPMAWLAMLFPPQVKFIGVDTGFPESPAWRARMRQAAAERHGPHYVMLTMPKNLKQGTLDNKLAAARWLGWTADAAGCAKLAWLGRHVRLQAELVQLAAGGCTLALLPEHRVDLVAQRREIVAGAAQKLQRYGIGVDAASCQAYPAALGREPYPYQLCLTGTAPDLSPP